MRFSFCLVVVAWISLVGVARADRREDARREFTSGQQADKEKDYQTAIEHYQRAYDLVNHHFALYNIATAYERLGQLRESATWFERYLDEAPQSLVKERREVERLVLELKLRPAKLTVKTTPPGARLLIDGQPAGVTPFTKLVRGGGHRVTVELEGQREERDVFLEFAEPYAVDVTLNVQAKPTSSGTATRPADPVIQEAQPATRTSGTLVLSGGPEGAFVAIDDRVIGRLPGEFHLERGQHKLGITMYGFQPYENNVMIMTGGRTQLEVKLEAGAVKPPGSQLVFGYYAGAVVGADVRGTGAQYMGELGYRLSVVDIAARVGSANSRLLVDLVFRWTVLRSRLAPFIQAGYVIQGAKSSESSAATGWMFGGGLRYDVTRGAPSVSVLVESGIRLLPSTSTSMMMDEDNTVFIPLLASLHVTFGVKTPNR